MRRTAALADRDYSDVSETAAANARLLEDAMTRAGFTGYSRRVVALHGHRRLLTS